MCAKAQCAHSRASTSAGSLSFWVPFHTCPGGAPGNDALSWLDHFPWLFTEQNFFKWSSWAHPFPHSKEHSKPLAQPVETGSPSCLNIWPLQNKPLIFCGSRLASLHCGRVVWLMSPMWEAAGFRAPAPLLQAFEQSIRALPGALPLWPAPLFSISSGESIDMLKGGSESMSSSDMDRKKTNSTE